MIIEISGLSEIKKAFGMSSLFDDAPKASTPSSAPIPVRGHVGSPGRYSASAKPSPSGKAAGRRSVSHGSSSTDVGAGGGLGGLFSGIDDIFASPANPEFESKQPRGGKTGQQINEQWGKSSVLGHSTAGHGSVDVSGGVAKAIALDRSSGEMHGRASYQNLGRVMQSRAADFRAGLSRAGQFARSPRVSMLAGAARMRGLGGHHYESADSGHAARVLARMASRRGMNVGPVKRLIASSADGVASVSHVVPINGHDVTIHSAPKAMLQKMGRPPRKSMQKPVAPAVSAGGSEGYQAIHAAAGGAPALTKSRVRRNWYGKKVGMRFEHVYTNVTPHVAARAAHARLSATHDVTPIGYKKRYDPSGNRVLASFEVRPRGGGDVHTLHFVRK